MSTSDAWPSAQVNVSGRVDSCSNGLVHRDLKHTAFRMSVTVSSVTTD